MASAPEQFKPLELLDDGPHTRLYRAVRQGDDARPLILKVAKAGPDGLVDASRLEYEYSVASRIDSPAVVKVYGLTTFEGLPALMLEDFGGHSLDRMLGSPLELGSFLALASQIAGALSAVHQAGVIHCDLRPHNLIYEPKRGLLKLTDFGAALVRGSVQPEALARPLEGVLAYIAPEQTGRMGRSVDRRADLYALGVTFYELLSGTAPFAAEDALEWMHCHLARAPQPPSELLPQLPEPVSELILRLLAKAPEERYQSAHGLVYDLERCRSAYETTGLVEPFRLGEHDLSDEFRIPQRLYGRALELMQLHRAFAGVVAQGESRLCLVSGYSGVGKSSLVRELHTPIARERGLFLSGKCDQYQRHIPYFALTHAMGELVHQLLSVSAERLGEFTSALQSALGSGGGVLTEVFPALSLLIGEQPPVGALGPTEKQNRLGLAFAAAMHVFATAAHPVVLFLDDVQWADAASLELLESFWMRGAEPSPLLCILAYRDNEVDAVHPFTLMVGRLAKAGLPIERVEVLPLDQACINALIADTLHMPAPACAPLSNLVFAKTQGNPFFVNEFLKTLYLDGLLRFDAAIRGWRWQQAEIEARSITENVVHLMVSRLRKLAPDTQHVLRISACIGNTFELSQLAIVTETAPAALSSALGGALEHGLIVVERPDRYRFQHDRIQQAAYSLIEDERRPAVHLRIGRSLWKSLDREQLQLKLFEVVNQLDRALQLVTDPAERDGLLELNLLAGKKAKAATAYAQGCRYLTVAIELAPSDSWSSAYERSFSLYIELAECEYLSGQLERAQERFAELSERARTDLDRGKILYLQMKLFQVAGDFEQACATAIRSFELFGLAPPESDEAAALAVEREHHEALQLLGDRTPAELLQLPRMTDPTVRMIADLLESSAPPLYMVRPALFPWIVLKLLHYSLRYGNAEPSCYGYGVYALVRAATMGDVETGHEFALLAIRLNEQLGDVRLKGCVLHLLGDHVNFWKNPIASDLPILERGFAACLEGGDLIYSNYIGFQSPWHLYESGASLEEVWKLCERYAPFALRSRHLAVYQTIRLEQQFILSLKGLTVTPGSFESADFSEASAWSEIVQAKFGCGIVYFHILKLISLYTYGDFAGARSAAERALPELGAAFSMPIQVSFVVYHALTLAALYAGCDEPERGRTRATLEGYLRDLERWTRGCPQNFADKHALVGAELARITGDVARAMRLYEEAREAARKQNFVHYEALVCERAAALYREAGVDSVATAFVEDALSLYRAWGARGKAAQLEAELPASRDRRALLGRVRTPSPSSLSVNSRLDLLPVMKASQTISGEMLLPRLLERLMAIVIEYAGAERGQLLLYQGDEGMTVVAEADVARVHRPASDSKGADASAQLPQSVLHYVERTKEWVLLDDAELPHKFSSDPYFARRKPRSILCLPISRKGKLTGLFYLENNLLAGAFSAERITVLELLAAQTAISIDNSRLYQASQEAIQVRDAFLSIASHELKTPLTPLKLSLHSLLSLLQRSGTEGISKERLTRVLQSSDAQLSRLSRLIDELLDVSRIQRGKLTLEREPVDLSALTAAVIERHQSELTRARCTVELEAAAPVVGSWDRLRVEQAVTNLFVNAIKYGPGKPIEVLVSQLDGKARVLVADSGIGIAAADMKRIFERFERVASVNNVSGLGLGLFITREIAEAHGGGVRVESEPGAGARFVLELPL